MTSFLSDGCPNRAGSRRPVATDSDVWSGDTQLRAVTEIDQQGQSGYSTQKGRRFTGEHQLSF